MGKQVEQWHLWATLDAHGGERERQDAALWEELGAALDAVVGLPQYAHMHQRETAAPESLTPQVRARALLALAEAAASLVDPEEHIGACVDVGSVGDALIDCAEQLQWHAYEQHGESTDRSSFRRIDGRVVPITEWLNAQGRKRP